MEKKALIAMSGGVDSSVAALLCQEAGYDCMGVTLALTNNEDRGILPGKDLLFGGRRGRRPQCGLSPGNALLRVQF